MLEPLSLTEDATVQLNQQFGRPGLTLNERSHYLRQTGQRLRLTSDQRKQVTLLPDRICNPGLDLTA